MAERKRVLITGGAGRYGSAIARRLGVAGWYPLIADRDLAAAERVAGAVSGDALRLDVTDQASVARAVADLGPLDALVNAAGGRPVERAFSDSDPDSWAPIIDFHFSAVLNCCHAVLPGMLAARRGVILSLAACEGLRAHPGRPLYSVAKAATIVFTEQLVRECAPAGVRLNTILPPPEESEAAAALVAEPCEFLLSDRARLTNGACVDVSDGWALH